MDRDEFKEKDLVEQNLVLFDLLNEILDKLGRTNQPTPSMPVIPGVPAPPYIPTTPKTPDFTPPTIGCRVCGLKMEGTGGYVCGRMDCPMGVTYTKT